MGSESLTRFLFHGWRLPLVAALLVSSVSPTSGATASDQTPFYRGKRITFIIGTGTGGDYDLHGRLLARHYAAHIPGVPQILIQNMPGAGSILAANHIYRLAPQDGTVVGNILNTVPLGAMLGTVNAQFNPADLQWIGNMRHEPSVVLVRDAVNIRTLDDARNVEAVMGATSPVGLTAILAKAINNILGTKFRIVAGYKETAAIDLALERGEVDGIAGGTWYGTKDPYFERVQAGSVRILVQVGLRKAPDLPDVPLLTDLARNEDEKQLLELFSSPAAVGKPTIVGPNVPLARVAELQAAYMETMKDPKFLMDAEKLGIPISPITGDDLAVLIKDIFATPPRLVQRAREATRK